MIDPAEIEHLYQLLQIYRRQLGLLLNQQAIQGSAMAPAHLALQLASLREQIARAQAQLARLGATPTHHPDDTGEYAGVLPPDSIADYRQRLGLHRQRLRLLLERQALMGIQTDPATQIEIDAIRPHIHAIKRLLRASGDSAPDNPIDAARAA